MAAEPISVTRSDEFKHHLRFFDGFANMDNVAYHFQYLEFCYIIRFLHEPKWSTGSLLNKTIIVEIASIAESILDDVLCALKVVTKSGRPCRRLKLRKNISFPETLDLAESYEIINKELKSALSKLFKYRAKIHFKRYLAGRKKEFEGCDNKDVEDAEKTLKLLIRYIVKQHNQINPDDIIELGKFPWPWDKALEHPLVKGVAS